MWTSGVFFIQFFKINHKPRYLKPIFHTCVLGKLELYNGEKWTITIVHKTEKITFAQVQNSNSAITSCQELEV